MNEPKNTELSEDEIAELREWPSGTYGRRALALIDAQAKIIAEKDGRLQAVLHSSFCTKCGWHGTPEPMFANSTGGGITVGWKCANVSCGYMVHEPKSETIAELESKLQTANRLAAEYNAALDRGAAQVTALHVQLQTAEREKDDALAQLPEGMKRCTIRFRACDVGHGWLTADNWVQSGCPTCALTATESRIKQLTEGLTRYARHLNTCQMRNTADGHFECSCGLAALLTDPSKNTETKP